MTKQEKRRFMRELTANVLRDALAKVPQMPEEWDGHELRRYLADKFEDAGMTLRRPEKGRGYRVVGADLKRLRAYENEVIVRNL